MHKNGMQWIPVLQSGISLNKTADSAYTRGHKKNIFLPGEFDSKQEFVGKQISGDVVFPDWYADDTHDWWVSELDSFYQKVPFDGLWLTMNEPAVLCEECSIDSEDDPLLNGVQNKMFYIPGGVNLNRMTIPMDVVHSTGDLEIDAHATFGHMQSKFTWDFFDQNDIRPFVYT